MKKMIAILTVAVFLFSMMAVPAMAADYNLKMGDVPKSVDAIKIDAEKDPVYDKGLKTVISGNRMLDGYDESIGTSATAWLVWQDGFLYCYAEIMTPVIVPLDIDVQTDTPWDVDSLEIFFESSNGDEANNIEQYRVDFTGYCSIQFQTTGVNSYGDRDAATGEMEGAGKIIPGGYAIEMKINNAAVKAGAEIGFLYQINDMREPGARNVFYQDEGEGTSWAADTFDYIVLSATEVTGVVEAPPADDVPVDAAPPAADDAPAPAPSAPAPAAPTGNAGIIVFAAVMMIAAAGIVVFRKQTSK